MSLTGADTPLSAAFLFWN